MGVVTFWLLSAECQVFARVSSGSLPEGRRFKSCHRNQHLRKAEKNTQTAIRPDGGFLFLGGVVAMAGSTIFVSEVAHEL